MRRRIQPVNHANVVCYLAVLWAALIASVVAGFLIDVENGRNLLEEPAHFSLILVLVPVSFAVYGFLYIDIVKTYRYRLLIALPALAMPSVFVLLIVAIPFAHLLLLTVTYLRSR